MQKRADSQSAKCANCRAGFTLIEAVMVILIVGILSAVAVPNLIDFRDDAKIAITKDEMSALKRAIVGDSRVVAGGAYVFQGFEADVGRAPTALSELVVQGALPTYDPLTRNGWRGPYLDTSSVPDYSKDAWGTAYVYSTAPRMIRSWGPNLADDAGAGDDITLTF